MSGLSTHVLDLARGRPASGVAVRLERRAGDGWHEIARTATDGDGRIGALLPADVELQSAVYRITFELAAYFAAHERRSFYPEASVVFEVRNPQEHFHVPLLLSPFGYSTYRGS